MLNDARVASACLYVKTCQRVRNSKNIATIRDFQVYIRVNSTIMQLFNFVDLPDVLYESNTIGLNNTINSQPGQPTF